MEDKNKISKTFKSPLWGAAVLLVLSIGIFMLMSFAMKQKDKKVCTNIETEITGAGKEIFIDENNVLDLINSNGNVIGKPVSKINLRLLETEIEKNVWVKNDEMFFDNNQVLHINIKQRQPVARVFAVDGSSFYVDSAALRLPLSDKQSAETPAFTGFAGKHDALTNVDSITLYGIVKIAKYILADSFWMAQVQQINIKPDATFEIIPSVGHQIIVLGNADSVEKKFKNLYTFYEKAWLQNGIDKYEKLDARFENQIVAVKRNGALKSFDSLANKQLIDTATITPKANVNEGLH